ncbi:MAG: SDR family oxidoreductase [Erysipelotrichaceae bacterium]|nr:SDR family oxidoreductase [Erysipelotrichaceae bacterium]
MLTLKGRTCVIAGGTGNMAIKTVYELLEQGMNVALLSHFPEKCQQIVKYSENCPGRCEAYGNEKTMEETLKEIHDEFGSIDVFISKTGILEKPVLFEEIDPEKLNELFDRQVTNIVRTVQLMLPYLKTSRAPRIILFTTIGSFTGYRKENLMDSIVKGAVNSLILNLAETLAEESITVNGVCISGFIQDHNGEGLDSVTMLNDIPLGRLGNENDFAAAVEYLVSEEAGFITGEIIKLNGGMGLRS